MKTIKDVTKKINSIIAKATDNDGCTSSYFYDENDGDYVDTHELINEALEESKKYGIITHYSYELIGSFHSPGYDLDCYAVAFSNHQGNLELIGIEYENY